MSTIRFFSSGLIGISNIYESLQLKSAPISNAGIGESMPTAVLCTHDVTFEVRQMQSSNTLYIFQSIAESGTPDAILQDSSGLITIAQCKGMLELVPFLVQPQKYLREMLPIFDDENTTLGVARSLSKKDLILDAACSEGEFDAAWTHLCAFEFQNKPYLPSTTALKNCWASFTSAALLKGLNLVQPFGISGVESLVCEEGIPKELLETMLLRVSSQANNITHDICTHLQILYNCNL